ncbi:MAG: hypothetical protein KA800_10350 [Thauera sp.]|nr:hypothetical protein [Thauera sp.]
MGKYCKTAKGHQEISDRAAGLGARARRLLILIDGQRDSEELARLAGDAQVEDSLRTLAEAGFIEADAASAATAMAPAAHAGPTPAAPGGRQASLALAQDFMMNTLRTFHGPYGKLDLVKRIHASTHSAELRALFEEWLHSISESRIGRKRADELSARLLEVMPG